MVYQSVEWQRVLEARQAAEQATARREALEKEHAPRRAEWRKRQARLAKDYDIAMGMAALFMAAPPVVMLGALVVGAF